MKMMAAVLTGPKKFEYMEVERPRPQANEVLVQVRAVGICGTDVELFDGTMPFFETGLTKYPLIPGHEWSGVVSEVGEEVDAFKPGDRVTGDCSIGCANCYYCKQGLYGLCRNRREVGISGGKDGAFADYILMPERHVYKLPDSVSFDAAAMTEPTAVMVRSIRRAPIKLGDVVLVLGTGPISLMGLQAAIAAGAGYTIVAGRKEHKLQIATQLGADTVVNTSHEDLARVVERITEGRGVDYVMEGSGSVELMALSPALTRDGGVINTVGIYTTKIPRFDVSDIVLRDISVIGSLGSDNVWEATLRLMGAGRLKTDPCISHHFHLKDIHQAMKIQKQASSHRIKILLHPHES